MLERQWHSEASGVKLNEAKMRSTRTYETLSKFATVIVGLYGCTRARFVEIIVGGGQI